MPEPTKPSQVAQIESQIDICLNEICDPDVLITGKLKEHDAMLKQVHDSPEYELVFQEQLERALKPLWDEAEALREKIKGLQEALKELGACGKQPGLEDWCLE